MCRRVYPGAQVFNRKFHGLVVYLTAADDANFIKDLLNKYKDVPVKVLLGK